MTEVEVSHPRSEHDEMSPLIHYVNDVACPCWNGGGDSNDDAMERGLERVAGLPFGVAVRGRRGEERCPWLLWERW